MFYAFDISCFICDAPARAYVKQIKGHSGYYGCDKCTQSGDYAGKVIFPKTDAPLRTDTSFDEMTDEGIKGRNFAYKHIAVENNVNFN